MTFASACTILFFMLVAENANDAQDAKQAIALHAATLSRIHSIYVKFELLGPSLQAERQEDDAQAQRRKYTVSEIWRVGARERSVHRAYVTVGPDGVKEYPNGDVTILGYSEREARRIDGWDPERPLPLPLKLNPFNYADVRCDFSARSPTDATSQIWTTIFFELAPGVSLAKLAELSEIEQVPTDDPAIIRLEVKAARGGKDIGPLASRIDALIGVRIDLEPGHGYLIRRITWPNGGVREVEQFSAFGEGIWVPKQIRNGLAKPKSGTVIDVVDCRVNGPISEEDLTVNFPEGARVVDQSSQVIHVWGRDGPVTTLSHADFDKYLEQRRPWWAKPLVWLSIALVFPFLLFGVVFVRRMSKRKSAAQGAPG